MNASYRLTALLMGTTVLVAHPFHWEKASAQVSIGKLAQDVTVFIQGVNNPDNFGSGVIIGHSGKSYTVLTSAHVVSSTDQYTIQTGDGLQYNLKNVQRLTNLDMAVFQFDSSSSYQIARLGNSDQMSLTSTVYVAGFPKPGQNITVPVLAVTNGEIAQVLPFNSARDGYGFAYTNSTRAGMSGGPVFNSTGEVIAIHGRKESEAGGGATTGAWVNLGIPINRYKSGISQIAKVPDENLPVIPKPPAVITPPKTPEAPTPKKPLVVVTPPKTPEAPTPKKPLVVVTPPKIPKGEANNKFIGATTPFAATTIPFRPAIQTSTKQVCEDIRIAVMVTKRCHTENVSQFQESTSGPAPSNGAETYVNSGNDHVAKGNYQGALEDYTNAIQGNSELAIAFFNRGLAFYNLDQKDRAISDFSKAADLFKSQGDSEKLQKTQNILQALTQANS
jgi:S1-C subfamily serine protease